LKQLASVASYSIESKEMVKMTSPYEIREYFTSQPNGDLGFTFRVVARENGVEINGHYVGPKEQGFASATEHFGQFLALLARDDRRKRQDDALPPDLMARWVAAMRRFDVPPEQGLSRAEASAAFRENGLDPRSSGSWAMHGWITRDGDLRYITDKGKDWLEEHDAV
jgi:hypothetical protein